MSVFRDAVASDLGDVFLGMDEFAEEHTIGYEDEEVAIPAVLQSPTAREMFLNHAEYSRHDGVYGTEMVLHCKAEDLPEVPAEGAVLRLDGTICLVESCINDMGMLSITLHANERR